MAEVRFYIMRHGAHTDGQLNEVGRRQVMASASQHLAGIEFDYCMASEMPRAVQTIQAAAHALGQPIEEKNVIREPAFGFSFVQDTPLEREVPYHEFQIYVANQRRTGKRVNVEYTLSRWKSGTVAAAVLACAMRLLAQHFVSEEFLELLSQINYRGGVLSRELNILVGGHATCTLATPDPANTEGAPGHADLAAYSWTVDEKGSARLTGFRFLPAPAMS